MLVSHKLNLIILGNNKTGSSSIEKAFDPYRDYWHEKLFYRPKHYLLKRKAWEAYKHCSANDARRIVGKRFFDKALVITCVRDPFARFVSEYTKHRHTNGDMIEGFREYTKGEMNWLVTHKTQDMFVKDENGRVIVDYIMRLERLQEDINVLCDKLEIEHIAIPRINTSDNKRSFRDFYDRETIERVLPYVEKDLKQFGYSLP